MKYRPTGEHAPIVSLSTTDEPVYVKTGED